MISPDTIRAGDALPEIVIELPVTTVVATAIATRDYQPVHHDVDRARSFGNADVFLNTHTTAGYLERLVTTWAGPGSFLKRVNFRLGKPSYAGDTLRLNGTVVRPPDGNDEVEIGVTGTNALGTHVEGTVLVRLAPR